MSQRSIVTALAVAFAAAAYVAPAYAQGTYYIPPKLAKQGKATSPNSGPGTVVVKVLVNADGTFKVQDVIKSTNHGNDKAALEIAASSKYKPATRGNKPILAFYDYTLKFTASSVTSVDEDEGSGALADIDKDIRGGNYTTAKSALEQYIAVHPGDAQAQGLRGVTDTYMKDYEGAVKAFDGAGTVPAKDAPSAALAYVLYAQQQANAKNGPAAVDAAKKGVQYAPTFASYNVLGYAQQVSGDYPSAIESFQKALSLAAADSTATPKSKSVIEANLATAYASSGDLDKAKAAAAQAVKLDPSSTAGNAAIAAYYFKKGQDAAKAGNLADAATNYESGAQASPADAVALYTEASLAYLNLKPNADPVKAQADAQKALAIEPDNARANFLAGIALADQGKSKDALTYLNKADAAAKAQNDTALATQIETNIKQLSGTK